MNYLRQNQQSKIQTLVKTSGSNLDTYNNNNSKYDALVAGKDNFDQQNAEIDAKIKQADQDISDATAQINAIDQQLPKITEDMIALRAELDKATQSRDDNTRKLNDIQTLSNNYAIQITTLQESKTADDKRIQDRTTELSRSAANSKTLFNEGIAGIKALVPKITNFMSAADSAKDSFDKKKWIDATNSINAIILPLD